MSDQSSRSRRSEPFHLRVTPEVIARLDVLADKLGTSRAGAAFKTLEWSLPPLEQDQAA